MTECMQNTGEYGSMVKALIENQKSSGKPIPTDPYNLAVYVHDNIGRYMSDSQQRNVFYALSNELKLQLNKEKSNDESLGEFVEKSAASEKDGIDVNNWIQTPNIDSDIVLTIPLPTMVSDSLNADSLSSRRPSKFSVANSDQSVTNLSDISSIQGGDSARDLKQDSKTCGRNMHSAPKGRTGDPEIIRCSKVGAYVLIDEATRCPDPNTPEARQIRFKVDCLLYLQPSDPFYQYEMAERHIEDSDLLSSSWQEAIVCFTKASSGFAKLGLFRMAANCCVRMSDCFRITGCEDEVGKSLVSASKLHQKERKDNIEGQQAAMAAIQNAVSVFSILGRELTSANLSTEAAELCIKAGNPGLGIDILHLAHDTMKKFGQFGNARRCLIRATEISVMDFSDFREAIDTLEKIAVLPPQSTAYLSYFKALVCRIVCVPMKGGADTHEAIMDVKKVFNEYMDLCSRLSYGSERKLLLTMIDALTTLNEDAVEKECEKYIASHKSTTEVWLKLVLKRISDNLRCRNAAIEEMFSK